MSSDKDIAFPMTAVNSFVTNPINDPSEKTASFLPKAFSSKNTVIGERKETPLEELNKFVKEIQEADSNHEEIANKYLELFDRESRFIIKTKDVKKYLPNFNHKSEKKLLQLFGVTPTNAMNPKNPKEILYFFSPYQYILTTMVHAVSYATFEDRIDFAFQMYDSDSDGRISKADLKDMFTLYGKENAFRIDNQNLDSIVNVIFKSMGQNESGLISLTDFRAFFSNDRAKSIKINVFERRKAKTHFSKIEVGSPTRKAPRQSGVLVSIGNWFSDLFNLMQKSVNKIVWMTIWGAGLLYFFISTFIMFYDKLGIPAGFAKGCAASIDYNIAFMLVLATKSLTTIIRTIGLGKILPVNINIYLHTRIGFVTFGASWIHTLMHLIFILPTLSEMGPLVAKYTNVTEQEPYLWWVFASLPGWTGILSIIIMTILPIFAIKKLRNANYERFWYTHYLWLPLFILVSVHGQKRYLGDPKFYLYGGIPAIILVLEKIGMAVDFFRKPFKVLDMTYLDSEVIELKVNRPAGFKYIPGQYCRIKVPRLSNFQWHPFSISSSPDDDFVSFHISPVGDWTNQVKQLALDYKAQKLSKTPSIFVMGPYGAPSQHYNDFSHLMIISSGIGATPFASIMRHINEQVKKDPESQSHARTVSVDFYWVNKKPSSHIWLASLFKEIQANEAVKGLIKINMFFTSPHEKYDLRSILLWKGLEILYAEGIKVKGLEHFDLMRWGRPEWSEIFQKKAEDVGSGQVGVFFCGNTMLAKELHDNCVKHSGAVQFRFRKEIF